MATPIRHKICGEIVMWYVGTEDQRLMRSADIFYLDGARPVPESRIPLCPYCGGGMGSLTLVRCFREIELKAQLAEKCRFLKNIKYLCHESVFCDIGKVHDWRNYVPKLIQDQWMNLTTQEKLLVALTADAAAEEEEWN